MSENCGLPNVDIFDPVQCSKRWSQCATQQQINVYLNSEIVRTQECLQLFKTAQAGVNEILDGKIKNHETRIAALEAAEKQLADAQASLTKQFAEIQAGNTAYQTSVDNTLKLYQSSINALTNTTNTITAEQQKMWNEINALKSSIDPAKIEQALAGYDAIMSQTKALIEENNTALQVQFKQLETKFNTLESETLNALSDSESAAAKRFSDFARTVSGDIEAQNARLNTFINTTTDALSKLQGEVSGNKAAVDSALDGFTKSLKDLEEVYKAADCKIEQRIAAEEQARKDGDAALAGQLASSDKLNKDAIKELQDSVKDDLNTFEQNVDNKLLNINNDIRDRTDKQIDGLDDKLSSRIKALEVTEEAHNQTTNKRIDALEEAVDSGVSDRIAESAAALNQRITQVETGAQVDNANLEAKLTKAIADGDAEQGQGLTELKKLVDTQGELIQASRDEATLAWEKEVKDRIAGDEKLQAELDGLSQDLTQSVQDGEKKIDEAIKAASDALDERVTANEGEIEALKTSDGKQWTTINNTVEAQNQLRAQVDKMQEVVDTLDPSHVETLQKDLDALKEQVDGLDQSEDLEALKEKVDLHTAQIEALQGAVKAHGDQLPVVQERVDTVEGRLDAIDKGDTALAKRVTAVETKNETQQTQIDAVIESDASARGRIQVLETNDAKQDERLTALESAESGDAYDDTELRGRVSGAETKANDALEEAARLNSELSITNDKVTALGTPPTTVSVVSTAGQDGAGFLDASKQAVRVTMVSNTEIRTTFSALHHRVFLSNSNGTAEATQNGTLQIDGRMSRLVFFPIKAGYAAFECDVVLVGSNMYSTMTKKPLVGQ